MFIEPGLLNLRYILNFHNSNIQKFLVYMFKNYLQSSFAFYSFLLVLSTPKNFC